MIVSHATFIWICTAIVFFTCGLWLISDIVRWTRLDREDPSERHDRVFGYIMGIAIGALGLIGVARYHL